MFADTRNRQVPDENEVTRSLGESTFEMANGVLVQAGEELREGVSDALRSLPQPVSIGVLANSEEDLAYRPRYALLSVPLRIALLVRHASTPSRTLAAHTDQEG